MLVHLDIRGSRRTEKSVEVRDGETLLGLLRSLSIRPDAVVCFSGSVPIAVDAVLTEGEDITVLEAASGG